MPPWLAVLKQHAVMFRGVNPPMPTPKAGAAGGGNPPPDLGAGAAGGGNPPQTCGRLLLLRWGGEPTCQQFRTFQRCLPYMDEADRLIQTIQMKVRVGSVPY